MKELELYVHVPFCVEKCGYCDFLSGRADAETMERYVDALVLEIEEYKGLVEEYLVCSVFLGGGTPSLLSGEQVRRIFECIRKVFVVGKDAEITMEMNPGTVLRENVKAYVKAGVNRVSLGLQSTEDEELRLLGRIHTYEEFLQTFEMLREVGISNINVDLISGIPGQKLECFERSLCKVAELGVEHISAYSLIVEEGTKFYTIYGEGREGKNGYPPLPSEEEERKMYYLTKQILSEAGYERYEISNYAKCGFACRHNLGYWERKEYVGFGIGAASLFDGERFCNTKDRKRYIDAGGSIEKIREEREVLTRQACMEEFMFLGLRKIQGVSESAFKDAFGITVDEVYAEIISKLAKQKLIVRENGSIALTEKGIDISNSVMVEFLL